MAQSIIKFRADSGRDIQLSAREITDLVCPTATEKEVALFLRYCEAHRLDPIGAKDAYLIKYGGKQATMVTGYQVFNRRAQSFPSYRGIESGVVVTREGKIVHKDGAAVYKAAGEQLIGGWARVHVAGWDAPVYSEVDLDSYSTGMNNWKKMPGLMIEKVAKSNAWRTAYPDEFAGMYTAEEMDQTIHAPRPAQDVHVDAAPAVHTAPQAAPAPAADPAPAFADPTPIKQRFSEYADVVFRPLSDKRERYDDAMEAILCAVGGSSMHELSEEQVSAAVEFMGKEIDACAGQAEIPAMLNSTYEIVEEF